MNLQQILNERIARLGYWITTHDSGPQIRTFNISRSRYALLKLNEQEWDAISIGINLPDAAAEKGYYRKSEIDARYRGILTIEDAVAAVLAEHTEDPLEKKLAELRKSDAASINYLLDGIIKMVAGNKQIKGVNPEANILESILIYADTHIPPYRVIDGEKKPERITDFQEQLIFAITSNTQEEVIRRIHAALPASQRPLAQPPDAQKQVAIPNAESSGQDSQIIKEISDRIIGKAIFYNDSSAIGNTIPYPQSPDFFLGLEINPPATLVHRNPANTSKYIGMIKIEDAARLIIQQTREGYAGMLTDEPRNGLEFIASRIVQMLREDRGKVEQYLVGPQNTDKTMDKSLCVLLYGDERASEAYIGHRHKEMARIVRAEIQRHLAEVRDTASQKKRDMTPLLTGLVIVGALWWFKNHLPDSVRTFVNNATSYVASFASDNLDDELKKTVNEHYSALLAGRFYENSDEVQKIRDKLYIALECPDMLGKYRKADLFDDVLGKLSPLEGRVKAVHVRNIGAKKEFIDYLVAEGSNREQVTAQMEKLAIYNPTKYALVVTELEIKTRTGTFEHKIGSIGIYISGWRQVVDK